MSRNFDLLTQIGMEPEFGKADQRSKTVVDKLIERVEGAGDLTPNSDQILRMVQNVFLSHPANAPRVIVFCGVDTGIGGSSICSSVGRVLEANSTQSVCLVDANVRAPRLSALLQVDASMPLAGTSAPIREQCVPVEGNLWLAGTEVLADGRGGLRSVEELKPLIQELRESFEYVLISAPGVNGSGDAQVLGKIADAAILVVEADQTRRLTARKAKETLDHAGIRLLGAVLHNRTFPIPKSVYKRL